MQRLIIALAVTVSLNAAINDPVRTDSGMVLGIHGTNPDITVFKGLPFAAPPVGELRWRAPKPVAPWNGVRKADEFGPMCMQAAGRGGQNERRLPLPQRLDCREVALRTPPRAALDSPRRLHQRLRLIARHRRRSAREERRGRRNHQLSARRARLLRSSRTHQRVRPQRLRQLRSDGSDRRPRMGAEEHRRLRRRSETSDRRWRFRRCIEHRQPRRLAPGQGLISARHRRKRRMARTLGLSHEHARRGRAERPQSRLARRPSCQARRRDPEDPRRWPGHRWLVPARRPGQGLRRRQTERRAGASRLEQRRRNLLRAAHHRGQICRTASTAAMAISPINT